MTKIVQENGQTATESAAYVGPIRSLVVDTDNFDLILHDGSTLGGHRLMSQSNADARYLTIDLNDTGGGVIDPNARGILVRTAPGSYSLRQVVSTSGISIVNPDGFGGNIEVDIAATIPGNKEFSGTVKVDGVLTAPAGVVGGVTGNLTGNVTGNLSGATVTATGAITAGSLVTGLATGADVNGDYTVNQLQTQAPAVLNPASFRATFENPTGGVMQLCYTGSSTIVTALMIRAQVTNGQAVGIFQGTSQVGGIVAGSASTSFVTTSDETEKTFQGLYSYEEAIVLIRADPVRKFTWSDEFGGEESLGWGAQTSHAVDPALAIPGGWFIPAVIKPEVMPTYGMQDVEDEQVLVELTPYEPPVELTPERPANKGDEGAVYKHWGLDQSKRVVYMWPVLEKHDDMLIDLRATIDSLTARIAALEPKG